MTDIDPILIAVDGGGTGCRVAVGTAGKGILAQSRGGPANITTSFDGAIGNITTTVRVALIEAGLDTEGADKLTAHVGLAGADTPEARALTRAALPYGHCTVTGDRDTSVAGVLGTGDGFVIALGTGTIIARQHDGQLRTVNGWGLPLSDHGSGAWLGKGLLAGVLLAVDGMADMTPLAERIAARLGGLPDIVRFSTTATPGDYATFAPDIFDGAAQGDPLALELVRSGARHLQRGLDALGFEPGGALSLAGGVGPHYAPYLYADYTGALRPPKGSALEGAFALARQAATAR